MARCRPPIPAKPERLPEIRHQHDIRLALPAREGELLSIGRPGEGKHIATREVVICTGSVPASGCAQILVARLRVSMNASALLSGVNSPEQAVVNDESVAGKEMS